MSTTATWRALGTTATVVVTDPAGLDEARAAVVEELAAIDLACSRFREDSELTAVNAAGGRPIAISPLLAHALAVALRAARSSGGLVDPTLGADLRRAGYNRDFAQLTHDPLADGTGATATAVTRTRPTVGARARRRGPAEVHARRRLPGWRQVELEVARGIVRVPLGIELDLGATAKALAADRAARAAHQCSGCGVLVSLGGDVALAGPSPPDGWAIRVQEDHAGPASAAGQTILLSDGGLATSGTTVRRWRRDDGVDCHHIVDPRTGQPAPIMWRTASVAAASCVAANTASTAAIVRGTEATAWLLHCGLPARLVAADGRVVRVGAWPRER